MNSPIRTSEIGLLQHLQLLHLPSELDITKYTQRVYPTFDCNQTQDPVIPTASNCNSLGASILNKSRGNKEIIKEDVVA
jgi:hypothetical protein